MTGIAVQSASTGTQADQFTGPPPQFAMMAMLTSHWGARAVHVAADLRLADLLDSGPGSVEHLAEATGTHPMSLTRLLRALSTLGVFCQQAPGVFANTPLSAVLSERHASSVGDVARLFGRRWHLDAWADLEEVVRSGRPGVNIEHPEGLVQFLDHDEEERHAFDCGMTAIARLADAAVLSGMAATLGTVPALGHVLSVSGGHSHLPRLLARRFPGLRVTVADRPTVADRWQRDDAEELRDGRITLTPIDVPEGVADLEAASADVVLLDRVLHDWRDEIAADLLRQCRARLEPSGVVVIIEQLLVDDEPRVAMLDLQMLVHRGGMERTVDEITDLCREAGIDITSVVPTYSPMTILIGRTSAEPLG